MDEKLNKPNVQNTAVLESIMEQYRPYVSAIVSRIIVPPMTAEDVQEVVNDVFLNFWKKMDTIDVVNGNMKGYLITSARNSAKNKFREYRETVALQDNDQIEVPDAYAWMEEQEKRRLIGEALKALPEDERNILIRHYFLYESTGEIAQKMHLKLNTVKSKLRRGRTKLEKELRERGMDR